MVHKKNYSSEINRLGAGLDPSPEYSFFAGKFPPENGRKYGRTDGKESTSKGRPVGRPSTGGQSQRSAKCRRIHTWTLLHMGGFSTCVSWR